MDDITIEQARAENRFLKVPEFTGPVAVQTFSNYPRKHYDYSYHEELSECIYLLIDECHPDYQRVKELEVFECDRVMKSPNITAEQILEDLDNSMDFSELPEDECWSDRFSEQDRKELNDYLEQWAQRGKIEVWEVTSRKVQIDWDEEIKRYLATPTHE